MTEITVQTFSWMKTVQPVNSEKAFYMLGRLANHSDTLVIVEQQGNGGAWLYCQKHKMVYSAHHGDICPGCRSAVLEVPNDGGVTTRNAP